MAKTIGTTMLSRREWLVIRMIAGGMSNKDIAIALSLTGQTVKSFIKRGRAKLELRGYSGIGTTVGLQRLVERGKLEWPSESERLYALNQY